MERLSGEVAATALIQAAYRALAADRAVSALVLADVGEVARLIGIMAERAFEEGLQRGRQIERIAMEMEAREREREFRELAELNTRICEIPAREKRDPQFDHLYEERR